ncbi:MAG: CocE/NonD family hydrolase [Deltaproteobacteria bacterium]|nr:CocE/NonD family hydrolase [Deltaproteobacteria bacterium]MCW5809101.1 CocE/NonD family hydrolase [Deltaproteobacteria bacterium]
MMTIEAQRFAKYIREQPYTGRADEMPSSAAYAATRPALHARLARTSHYVPMRDGVRLAVDVHLPHDRGSARLPAIVRMTRYFRGADAGLIGRLLGDRRIDPVNGRMRRYFAARGYAWIDVDVRGSGASTGVWHSPWSPLEVEDGRELLDWIVAQPWSNGRVGATGNSYDGTAAELMATTGHPALCAVAPRCSLYDTYTDVAYPGGVRQSWFTASWTRVNRSFDANRAEGAVAEAIAQGYSWFRRGPRFGDVAVRQLVLEKLLRLTFGSVRLVDGDRDAMRFALHERVGNLDIDAASRGVEYRDDVQTSALGPRTIDSFSPSAYAARMRAAGVPVLGISGWFDGAYPHAAIKRHLTLADGKHKLVLGPWNHGATMNVSPHAAARRAGFDLDAELLRFFDHHLLGRATDVTAEPTVRYYMMGAERWRSAPTWPPPEAAPRALYLGGQRELAWAPPATAGDDAFAVGRAGTGSRSRWRTLVSPFAVADYGESERRDTLVYRTAPLERDVEIAGHPVVRLFAAPDAADGALFAYLEEETRDGRVCYVTEGQLRLVHRGVDGAGARAFASPAPYRSFVRASATPATPGSTIEVVFDLLPVAHRFARGARIRLAIAGGDVDHFAPIPNGATSYRIARGPAHPSLLELPVLAR